MDRRDAIKAVCSSLGYTLTPVALSGLLSACATQKTSRLFSNADIDIMKNLGEVILPKTETPGARDVGAHLFVDVFMQKIAKPEDVNKFTEGMLLWKKAFANSHARGIEHATVNELHANLTRYFVLTPNEKARIDKLLDTEEPSEQKDKELKSIYHFLTTFKKLLMSGYYASELIGEKHLNYLPVPGEYEADIPVSEVGLAWSLGR